ncbi:hypothetical protein NQ317_011118 [Molorchus minor]|uniref:Uncharacterized protein n=1 Tax=Molorchus minor TaxID=1323400 RepID=A0ABQ9K234_9CUCU|nr:hypothetical protein NQ317_011118 [Molorchus minor]
MIGGSNKVLSTSHLGWGIKNDWRIEVCHAHNMCLRDTKVILNWDSTEPFSYQVNIYEENDPVCDNSSTSFYCDKEECNDITNTLKKSNKAYLIITFDRPQFIDKLSYQIGGNIIFQQRDSGEVCLVFPAIQISSLDATNYDLNNVSLSNGVKDILTIIAASTATDLVVILPREWSSSVDSTFEIVCTLNKLSIPSKCRRFFVAHRLSTTFDGSMIEVHAGVKVDLGVFNMIIHSRDEDSLFALLHHLHQNISGVVIIPKAFYENYILQNSDLLSHEDNLKRFKESAYKEIDFVKKFIQGYESGEHTEKAAVVKFRSDLADLEKHTDLYYLRICESNTFFAIQNEPFRELHFANLQPNPVH